jgi:hypothetical protein
VALVAAASTATAAQSPMLEPADIIIADLGEVVFMEPAARLTTKLPLIILAVLAAAVFMELADRLF